MLYALIFGLAVLSVLLAVAMPVSGARKGASGTPETLEFSLAASADLSDIFRRQISLLLYAAPAAAALIPCLFLVFRPPEGRAALTIFAFVAGAGFQAGAFSLYLRSLPAGLTEAAYGLRRSVREASDAAMRRAGISSILALGMGLAWTAFVFLIAGGRHDPRGAAAGTAGFCLGSAFTALFLRMSGRYGPAGPSASGPGFKASPRGAFLGADVLDSAAAESVAAMTLGAALWPVYGPKSVLFPLFARACGLAACAAGVMTARRSAAGDADRRMDAGLAAAAGAAMAGLFLGCFFLLAGNIWIFSASVLGLAAAGLYVFHVRYRAEYRSLFPARSEAGDIASGLAAAAVPAVLTAFAVLGSYYCGVRGLERHIFGGEVGEAACGLFGIAMAVTGALSISGYALTLGGFGDIARRVREMYEGTPWTEDSRKESAEFSENGRRCADTASGYAGAASVLASAALLAAYIGESARISVLPPGPGFPWIESIAAATAGAALPYAFGALYLGARSREGGGRGLLTTRILAALSPALVLPAAALAFRGAGHGPEAVSAILLSGIAGGWLFSAFIGNAAGALRRSSPAADAGEDDRGLLMDMSPLLNAFLRLLPAMALALAPLFAY